MTDDVAREAARPDAAPVYVAVETASVEEETIGRDVDTT